MGIEPKKMMKKRKLLIQLKWKNAKNTAFGQLRFAAGTRILGHNFASN